MMYIRRGFGCRRLLCFCLLAGGAAIPAHAQSFTFATPGGPVSISLSHVGPSGNLVAPEAPEVQEFRPPSLFSAPLPSGSGARALGLAGAFTALADDATAASWNPAGLLQLERPEASIVYRFSETRAEHFSTDDDFRVGENESDSDHLNYFSVDFPFHSQRLNRNFVVALNYQEAYDFSQSFTAQLADRGGGRASERRSETYTATQENHVKDEFSDLTVYSFLTTEITTTLEQLFNSDLLSDLEFQQEGIISAFTPSFAAEITPKLFAGLSLNFFQLDPVSGGSIRSITRARYQGNSSSRVSTRTTQTTSGSYEYEGTVTLPPDAEFPFPLELPISGRGTFQPFSDGSSDEGRDDLLVEGLYTELNEFEDLEGLNATLGLLYTVNRLISVGASVDLPWTADARQTKTIRDESTVYNADRTRVLDHQVEESTVVKDVEFDFPLFWSAGAVFRWTPQFYTTLDVGQTLWSDFKFQAEGEAAINPLDGSPYGEHPLDDCWSARAGAEYLVLIRNIEIPLRCGAGWEQRPAIGEPDEFHTLSLGTGIAFGRDPGRLILDVAYLYTRGKDVQGIVPEQGGLTSDVDEHDIYVSLIKHL